ncbi:MAG: Ig-like domain-containing protein, partial [Anaerotignum sp.]|nr:Ig-like domain-containing protein [Anaerotignum sp.]
MGKPENANDTTVTWKSSNTKYATVNAKGEVKTKKKGAGKTVTITATANDGSGVKATIKVK